MNPWVRVAQNLNVGESTRYKCCGHDAAAIVTNEVSKYTMYCFRCKVASKFNKVFLTKVDNNVIEKNHKTFPTYAELLIDKREPIKHAVYSFLTSKGLHPCMVPDDVRIYNNRIIFPFNSFDNDSVMCVSGIGRALDESTQPKWLFYGVKEPIVLTRNRGFRKVILCEDYLSALKISWVIKQNFALNNCNISVIPLLGTSINRVLKTFLVEECNAMLLMLDGDKAGYKSATKIKKDFNVYDIRISEFMEDSKDPKDMTIKDITKGICKWTCT